MRLHITHDDAANADYGPWFVEYILRNAAASPYAVHIPEPEPTQADAILILSRGDEYSTQLRRHPYLRQFHGKCYVYDVRDRPLTTLPGLYASMPKGRYRPVRHRTAGYFAPINEEIKRVAVAPPEPDLVCSFVGGPTAPVRRCLFRDNPFGKRSDVIIRNVYGWVLRESESEEKTLRFREFAELIARSRFVLCPRGIGVSSHRLFETMELGRVPVILSDGWVPPVGPDWPSFTLQVAERHWRQLPNVIEAANPFAAEMGERARRAWEEWFSPEIQFQRLAEWVEQLQRATPGGGHLDRFCGVRMAVRRTTDNVKRLAKRYIGRS